MFYVLFVICIAQFRFRTFISTYHFFIRIFIYFLFLNVVQGLIKEPHVEVDNQGLLYYSYSFDTNNNRKMKEEYKCIN